MISERIRQLETVIFEIVNLKLPWMMQRQTLQSQRHHRMVKLCSKGKGFLLQMDLLGAFFPEKRGHTVH